MLTHLPADTGWKVLNYDPVFSTNRRSIPTRRVQREKKKKEKVSSVRHLEFKKTDVFYSFLWDLSIFLVAGLQIWFSLAKNIFKSLLQEKSCYKGIKKDFDEELYIKAVNIAAIFSRYTETSAKDNEENVKRISLIWYLTGLAHTYGFGRYSYKGQFFNLFFSW